ncbi:MAG TPA: autotransporter-associated beta strand repeat-containing protein [Verrucomicrobiae bacterium]|nr:autotransporter-associated beta strand repeat-containing protein [Verrucomicrobiae bacterium]
MGLVCNADAQQLAFPGAQGYGQYATGGRGGTVYHVTTLADSGAGSFRDAVSQSGRTIVFDVGGYIQLASAVSCASGITIAGQTAPGGGIGVMGNEVSFYNDNNIICRYFRFRQGGSSTGSSAINIGSGSAASNMIFDHISVEFGQWDSIDAVHTITFTVQNSIIADPINQQFGAHVEGYNATWYGNIWANAHNRQPLCKADTIYINNVIYDYAAAYTTGDTGAAHNHDIINNYFITGPSSTAPQDDFFQINGYPQNLYFSGNLMDSDRNGLLGGSTTTPSPDNNGRTGNILSAPWSAVTPTIPTYPTVTAYRMNVSQAGALPRDPLDAQVVGQVMSLGTAGAIITSPAATGLANGGYGTINGGTALTDSDQDGMPDVWEQATGSNPLVADNNTVAADGYTLLEHYLNWLAAPHAFVSTNATDIDLSVYTLGFTNGAVYRLANFTNCSVTLTNNHFAHFVPNPGFTGLASFNFAVSDPDGSAMTNTMGLLVSITYIPKNLVWVGDGANNIWDNTNTADWFNGNDLTTFHSADSVTFDDTGSANPAINLTGTVAPGSVVFNNSVNNYNLGGVGGISGAGAWTLNGTGSVTVNNANAFSGAINYKNGGTITVNNGGTVGTGTITFNSGTLVNNYTSGTLTLPNSMVVPAAATGNINLGGAIAMTGTLTGAGTLNLNVQAGGTADQFKGNGSAFTGAVNILGSGGLLMVANGGAFSGFQNAVTTINAPVAIGFHDNSGGNTYYFGALSGNNPAATFYDQYAGAPTLNIGALNLNTTFAGQFQTSVILTKTGTGALTLSGNSSHTGVTTVSSGDLIVTGSISNSLVTVANAASLRGTGFLGAGATIQSGGKLLPGIANGQPGTLTISNGFNLTSPYLFFDLSASPGGANDQVVMQGGSLVMSGAQNYIFYLINKTLGAGIYNLITGASASSGGSGFVGNLPAGTRQTFSIQNPSSGVKLVVTGSAASLLWQGTNGNNWDSVTTNWLNNSAADKFYNLDLVQFDDTSTNGNVNIVGTVAPADVLVTNNILSYTIGGGALAGTTTLTKNGSGMLTLNSSNSFSGGIIVNGGTLQLVNNYYAAGTGPISLNGATLFLNGVGPSASTTIACAGNSTLQTYGQPYTGFALAGTGTLNLTIGGGGVFSPGGDWSGFSGTINFTTGNWLRIYGANIFGSSNAVWNLGGNGGLYNRNGNCTTYLGALFGGASAVLGGANPTAYPTLYVIGGVNTNSVFNGTISDGAAATSLIFNGPGSLALAGSSTFSGGTTVNGGTLFVNSSAGSGTGTGPVSINPGATLGGNGTIGGQVSFAAGTTLAPGYNGAGTLTITNDLGLNNASTLQFELGSVSDQVAVTGNLNVGGILNVTATNGFGPGTYTLFTYGGTLSIGTLTLGSLPPGYGYTIDTSVNGQVNLVVAQAQFGSVQATANGLVMSGSGGTPGANYYLLGTTNLSLPLANWTRLLTNQFDSSGNFIFTNAFSTNSPQQFYRLQLP